MFATITGRLPPPPDSAEVPPDTTQLPAGATQPRPVPGVDPDGRVHAVLEAQAAAGLELLTDAHARWPDLAGLFAVGLGLPVEFDLGRSRRGSSHWGRAATAHRGDTGLGDSGPSEPRWERPMTVGAWQSAAATTTLPVKATIIGPYTLGWYAADRFAREASPDRRRLTLAIADALHEEVAALVAVGCPFVEVIEDGATRISDHGAERALFRQSQLRLTRDLESAHLSLTIRGGNADAAGQATILDAPYASYLFDLIAGPDNWRLVRQVPAERGVICGALDPRPGERPVAEELVWAAHYAASSNGRGLERVGLAPANGLEHCSWDEACRRMTLLGGAARIAAASPEDIGRSLDPRAVDLRSAAMGRYAPQTRRPIAGSDEG